MIILDKCARNTCLGKFLNLVGLHKETALITVYLRLDQDDIWDSSGDEIQSSLVLMRF